MSVISGTLASVGRKSLLTLGTALLVLLIRFIKNIVLSRVLEPEFRGIWGLLNVIPDLLVNIGLFGLGASITYHVGKGRLDSRFGTGAALAASLILGLPLGLAAGFVLEQGHFWDSAENRLLLPYLPIIIAIIPFFCLRLLSNALLLGQGCILQLNACRLTESLLPLLIFLVLYYAFAWQSLDAAVRGWFWAMIAASLLPLALAPRSAYPPRVNRDSAVRLMGFGLRDHLGTVLHLLTLRLPMIFIAMLLPPAQLGYYAVAVSIAELLCILPESLVLPFTSALFGSTDATAPKLSAVVLRSFFWLMLFACLCALVGVWPFIYIFFGENYLPSAPCAMLLIPGMLFLGLFYLLKVNFANQGRPGTVSVVLAFSSAICLPASYLLTARYGILAAAAIASLAYCISASGLLLLHMRENALSLKDIFIFTPDELRIIKDAVKRRIFRNRKRANDAGGKGGTG